MTRVLRVMAFVVAFGLGAAWQAAAQDAAKIEQGKKVYAAQKCGLCHSVGGVGKKTGPLDGVGSKLTADEIKAWMVDAKGMTAKTKATRKPEMKSYPNLAPADLEALVAYMQSLKK